MACSIHWGPPGSYKTSSVVWFHLLKALREGRVVVTNVEGLYPLETLEDLLCEKFPDTAKLVRISSLKPKYRDLWRRWYHWMPIGAFVIMDEAQDIYPRAGWKESDLDYQPVEYYSSILPDWFIQYHRDVHTSFRPDMDDSTSDDTGDVQLDVNGLIIFPQTLNESYKRHRKYNWDVILCTPDINDIHKVIRGACEIAISYASKDSLFLFKRRPRLFEHAPTRKPTPTKNDVVYSHKVPVDVHLLYKSTQTGQITKSGLSSGPFSSAKGKFVLYVLLPLVFLCFCYFFYKVVTRSDPSDKKTITVPAQSYSPSPAGVVPPTHGNAVSSAAGSAPDVFVMPFDAEKIWLVGRSCSFNGVNPFCTTVFQFLIAGQRFQAQGDDLIAQGYHIVASTECSAQITDPDGHKTVAHCLPSTMVDEPIQQPAVEIQPSLIASNN